MQSIQENKPLCYTFIGSFLFFLVLSLEIIPPFNRWMQLVPFPSKKVVLELAGLLVVQIPIPVTFSSRRIISLYGR